MLVPIFAILFFILFPESAFAWGPGTHVEIAFTLLDRLPQIASYIQPIIAGREEWFVYGNVAADIVVGKKLAGKLHHCHNWKIGHLILRSARTDRERAAAYGYLTHLAADIIAHNYFVPCKMIENYKTRLLSHTYWEMRFDMHVDPKVWDKMKRMITGDFSPFDDLLERSLKRALFSFKTSKKIFSGILAVQRFRELRGTFSIYSKRSRLPLDTKEITHYMRLALDSAEGYLKDPKNAPCLLGDPTGEKKIRQARSMRRSMKKAIKAGKLSKHDIAAMIKGIKDELHKHIFTV